MKLTGRIPVELLDEERLTRIERKIVAGAAEAAAAPPGRSSRLSPAMAVAAVAVAVLGAGVAGWKLRGGAAAPELAAAPVEVRADGPRTTLDIGDVRIQSDPATAFTLTRPAGGVLVAMARGKVALEVGKRGGRPPLVVRAGDTEVVVVGTRFSVDYGDGTGDVDVRVTEGVVRVVRHREETRVAAGQAWTSRGGKVTLAEAGAGGAGTAGTAGAAGAAGAADGAGTAGERPQAQPPGGDSGPGTTIADAGRRGSGDIEIAAGKAPDVLRDRISAVPDVRTPQAGAGPAAPRNAGSGAATPDGSVGSARPQGGSREPRGDLKSLIRAQPVLPALDVGETDAAKAMAEYRAIMTREKGPTEAHAFYSMAVIQALKLGRTGDALATLAALRRRAPTSEYVTAALWLEVRIRCLRNLDDECRQVAEVYARHAPEGSALHVAQKIALTK